jgi:hypothetical protein
MQLQQPPPPLHKKTSARRFIWRARGPTAEAAAGVVAGLSGLPGACGEIVCPEAGRGVSMWNRMGASSRSAAAAAAAVVADDTSTPSNETCMCSEVTCDKNSGVRVSSLADVT